MCCSFLIFSLSKVLKALDLYFHEHIDTGAYVYKHILHIFKKR